MTTKRIKVILLFTTLILITSCESKRVMYISELKVSKNEKHTDFLDKTQFNLNIKKVLNGAEKRCGGISLNVTIIVCTKDEVVSVISSYKVRNPKRRYDLQLFTQSQKTKDEVKSFRLHNNLVKKLELGTGKQAKSYLIDNTKLKEKLEYFSN